MHGRSRMAIAPRIPTMPGPSASGVHGPGRRSERGGGGNVTYLAEVPEVVVPHDARSRVVHCLDVQVPRQEKIPVNSPDVPAPATEKKNKERAEDKVINYSSHPNISKGHSVPKSK